MRKFAPRGVGRARFHGTERSSAARPYSLKFVVTGVAQTEDGWVRKGPTYTGGFIGGLIGSFIPSLWGAGQLSMSSLLFFMIGGFFGIWIASRLFA